jgi:DNA-binding NarL/FixJ family response regulator
MRTVIVDDQPLFTDALSRLLSAAGFRVLATATTERRALESVRAEAPELLILEIALLGSDIGTFVNAAREKNPTLKLVVLTGLSDDRVVLGALAAGVNGYLLKSTPADRLGALLADLLDGHVVFSPSVGQRVFRACAQRQAAPPHSPILTPREQDVLRELVAGRCSSRSLAGTLQLSPKTVRFHVRNVLDKLHVHNRAQAVVFALSNGLVPLPLPRAGLTPPATLAASP